MLFGMNTIFSLSFRIANEFLDWKSFAKKSVESRFFVSNLWKTFNFFASEKLIIYKTAQVLRRDEKEGEPKGRLLFTGESGDRHCNGKWYKSIGLWLEDGTIDTRRINIQFNRSISFCFGSHSSDGSFRAEWAGEQQGCRDKRQWMTGKLL